MTYYQEQPILLSNRDYINYSSTRQNSFVLEVCQHLDPGFTADEQQVGCFSRMPVNCLQDTLHSQPFPAILW